MERCEDSRYPPSNVFKIAQKLLLLFKFPMQRLKLGTFKCFHNLHCNMVIYLITCADKLK